MVRTHLILVGGPQIIPVLGLVQRCADACITWSMKQVNCSDETLFGAMGCLGLGLRREYLNSPRPRAEQTGARRALQQSLQPVAPSRRVRVGSVVCQNPSC